MKKSIFISLLYISLLCISITHAMDQDSYRYELDLLKHDQDSFKIKISQTDQSGSKKSGSFIANFATHTCDDQKSLFAPFDIKQTTFGDASDADIFLWNIPNFGRITLGTDGSTSFGHSPDEIPLASDSIAFHTSGELLLPSLRVAKLLLGSQTRLCGTVIADEIQANHQVLNSGGLQTKKLTGKGRFANEGRIEFRGNQYDPALLGIKEFVNQSNERCKPTVHASHLTATRDNQKIINKKNTEFEVSEKLIIDKHEQDAFIENKGLFKTHNCDARRLIVNEGFFQANELNAQKIENREFGQVKILDKGSIEKLENEGEMDVNRSLEMNFCTNKGTIDGSHDLALRIRSAMKNHGRISLHDLLATDGHDVNAVLQNYKNMLFYENGSIEGGYLINMGLVKGLGMHLSRALIDNKKGARFELAKSTIDDTRKITNEGEFRVYRCNMREPVVNLASGVFEVDELEVNQIQNRGTLKIDALHLHGSLKNEQKGVVEVYRRSVVENVAIDNEAAIELHGDTTFTKARVTNKGKMICESGEIVSADSQLHNEGDWVMLDKRSATPLEMSNKGKLELVQSLLPFKRLENDKDLILRSGTYTIDIFKNKKLQLCDGNWAITDNPALQAPDKLILKKSKVRKDSDLGEIEAERDLLYDYDALPLMLRSQANISSHDNRIRTINQLKEIITPGKVSVYCAPVSIANGDIAFPNIGHLDLHIHGPFTKYGKLIAPILSLHVDGPFTAGKSNAELATIAATHGPLTVTAYSIDGKFAKFYGKGKTVIESTVGNITIGAPARGVDEAIKQQFINNLKGSVWYNSGGWGGFNPYIDNYLSSFDYTLNVPNGAYAVSDDHLTLKAAVRISINYGNALSRLGMNLLAPSEIYNCSGKVSSFGPVNIETGIYWHERGGYVGRAGWQPSPNTHASVGYPTGIAAILESLRRVNFKTNKIINNASSIRSGEGIFLNGSGALCPATGYHESVISTNYNWVSPWTGSHSYPALTLAPIVQSGKTIQMNLGDFVVSGNWNVPGVLMFAKTGLFSNGGKRIREIKQITGPEIVDVTQSVRQEAQQPGFYRLAQNGAVETEFPFGIPFAPHPGDMVVLENPQHLTPPHWRDIFNPLRSINLDLYLQQLLSNLAGKVYAGNAKGDQLSRVLWGNANLWRQRHGKEIMSQAELQQSDQSMLLFQIAHDGLTEYQKLLLCIAPLKDINPYQDAGVIVCDEFRCVIEGDLECKNNQIIALGEEGIAISSQTGDLKFKTESYRTVHAGGDVSVVEDHAYPQQQFIAPQGPVHTIAHRNIERTGTAIVAGQEVVEHAQTGSVTKNPLVLQKIVTTREEDEGLFSSSETITTEVSHQILPSTTIAGTHLHDQADISIRAVASQDVAGQSITYQAPRTEIEGIILADKTEVQSSSSTMFSEQSYSEMRETPCAMAATIRAPQVSFVGNTARINANITAHGLHDNTRDGAQFVAKVKEMLYSQQTLVDSPFMSMDAGCRGGYETMIPPMLMVDRIIRHSPIGQMLFESAVIDKDRTEIIGRFVETTYQLKKWHEEWCHKDQLISDEMLVVVAVAITFATQGMGAELLALTAESVAATAMVNAGFSAICATAGTAFLRTGDPLKTIEQLVSPQFLKSLAFDVASAGLCSQLGSMFKVPMDPGAKSLMGHVKEHALRSTINTFLNVAINNAPVGKSIGNACAQIPLNAVAGYVANSICDSHLNSIERKAAHSVLGGAIGFAKDGNSKGLASGAVGALTAETVGALLTADAFAVSDAAIGRLKKDGKPLTTENVQKAVQEEIDYRMKIAKVASGTVAAMMKLNPSTAMHTAANVTDNDVAIRAQIYALSEMQSLLTAASRAVANLKINESAEPAQSVEEPAQESKSSGKKNVNKKRKDKQPATTMSEEAQSETAREFVLHSIENRPNPYNDLIMECAQEWNVHDYIQEKKEKRSLYDRIVNPEMNPVIKETSEIIRAAFDHAINETINTYAMIPNPVGLACFATEVGRDLYQERTTPGEVAFNMALGYGALKGLQWTGRVMMKLYDCVLNKMHQPRYAPYTLEERVPFLENSLVGKGSSAAAPETDNAMSALLRFAAKKRVPFVEDPFAYKWSSATISGDVVLGSDAFSTAYELCTRSTWKIDPAAPFTVVGHGTPSMMIVNTQMHPKALSQANLKILKEKGEVMLNAMQLARLIRTAPGYNKGQHIHLFSCETGARADGLAQRWATRMGQQVSAFTENVHIFYDKPLFVTYCKATEKAGMVKTFYPQTGMSKVIASSLLLAGCDSSAENPVATYDDLMKEYAYEQQEKRQRSLFDRIVNPEMHPVIKETSKIIQAAVADLFDIFKNTPVDSRRRIPFVEDPKRGTWNKACISGDLILSSQEDAAGYLHVKKGWDKDKRCPFNVVAHGSPSHVQVANRDIHPNALALAHSIVLREEGSVMLNAAELKQVIETAPGYEKGQDVHLYSCKCGAEVEGIAQQLADEMQVRVSAFTADAVTYDYPIGFGFFTAGDAETGFKEIKTFYPRDPGEPRQRRISNIH